MQGRDAIKGLKFLFAVVCATIVGTPCVPNREAVESQHVHHSHLPHSCVCVRVFRRGCVCVRAGEREREREKEKEKVRAYARDSLSRTHTHTHKHTHKHTRTHTHTHLWNGAGKEVGALVNARAN